MLTAKSTTKSSARLIAAAGVLVLACANYSMAATHGPLGNDFRVSSIVRLQAPEIDPASTASALALLMGSLLVLRGRRRTPSRA
jgi:hypothetical protein